MKPMKVQGYRAVAARMMGRTCNQCKYLRMSYGDPHCRKTGVVMETTKGNSCSKFESRQFMSTLKEQV